MNGESLNILQERIAKLKADFPEIFTEGKIDIEKFKATFSTDINTNNERYVMNWAGKVMLLKYCRSLLLPHLNRNPKNQ
ncbi:hypothetical protein [Chitinophaga pinensis]|uniref:Site-specific DNA-methyltransferase n=1 Tax=Chitinophaga pinensis TaxID=79329 RepID=A0A5C6LNY6_9BACT|nr:hypothetical protein [Chitinophaga pinensis]TWV96216.1 hypothetical protein FEF09_23845 [Chitinophaga pinensis]